MKLTCLSRYYSVEIFQQIGLSGDETLRYQGISSAIALLGEFSCMMLIDRFGRRWPLIIGNLTNMVTFIIACILLAIFPPTANNSGAHWGFIIMTWLYNYSFSATCGPLSWIIPAEVFDTRTRSKGVSIATMTSFAFNTLIGQVTPIAMANVRWHYYIVFIVCNFTNAVFFYLFLPETANLPLEEMNYLWANSPWLVAGRKKDEFVSHDMERKLAQEEGKSEATAIHDE